MLRNIICIIVALVLIFAYIRYFEYRSLYFPMREIESLPKEAGLEYENIYIHTKDNIKLNAWCVPKQSSRYTLLFCHGNGGNISHRIEKILLLNRLGIDIFIFDYRGYGNSNGHPSEKGLYKDGQAAYDFLVRDKKIPAERIVLYGESLGGAVALEIASKNKVKALIMESAFTSTKDMAKAAYPIFPAFFVSQKYDSMNKIKGLKIPKLIIHSKNDEIVPFALSEKLFNFASEPKGRVILTGSHNTSYIDSKDLYIKAISDFLDISS